MDSPPRPAPTLGRGFLFLLTVASAATVANLFHNQPLLAQIADQLHVSPQAVGFVPSLCQVGYAVGLLLVVPAVFVWLAAVTSLDEFAVITVREGGREVPARFWLPDIHGGIMAPIAIASLAAIAGLFTVLDARSGDRRLVLAGFRPGRLLLSRLAVIVLLALLATAASLAVTATVFHARQWGLYAAANTLIALTYALVGVLIGPLFGRVAGVFVAFLVPFIDLGIEQSPVIHPRLSGWSEALPGYGGSRVLFDAALTPTFDDTGAVLIALAWIAALACAVVLIFRRTCAPPGTAGVNGAPGG